MASTGCFFLCAVCAASQSFAAEITDTQTKSRSHESNSASPCILMMRRFPPPWTIEALDGGFKIVDANAQTLAYVYGHTDPRDAKIAKAVPLIFCGSVCGAHQRGKPMTPEQTAIHNVAIEEAAQALEALQSNNTDAPEEYFTGFEKAKILGAAAIRALKA